VTHPRNRSQLAYVGVAVLLVLASLRAVPRRHRRARPQATSVPSVLTQPTATQPPAKRQSL